MKKNSKKKLKKIEKPIRRRGGRRRIASQRKPRNGLLWGPPAAYADGAIRRRGPRRSSGCYRPTASPSAHRLFLKKNHFLKKNRFFLFRLFNHLITLYTYLSLSILNFTLNYSFLLTLPSSSPILRLLQPQHA